MNRINLWVEAWCRWKTKTHTEIHDTVRNFVMNNIESNIICIVRDGTINSVDRFTLTSYTPQQLEDAYKIFEDIP